PKSLKNKSFAHIQELFEKAMKMVNTFVDYRTELVKESSKKAEIELEENSKKMLKNFDREDLEVLWSIVKARFKKTWPVNYMDNLLLHHLKTMFEHHMFNDVKLQVDYECKMAFELLRLVKKQLKEGYGRIVGIKNLLEVTTAKLILLVYKLLLLVLKVNAASTKVTTAQRL
ncbi:hypothetical protein Tco_1425884, partial [Tanacetum coccineum]